MISNYVLDTTELVFTIQSNKQDLLSTYFYSFNFKRTHPDIFPHMGRTTTL